MIVTAMSGVSFATYDVRFSVAAYSVSTVEIATPPDLNRPAYRFSQFGLLCEKSYSQYASFALHLLSISCGNLAGSRRWVEELLQRFISSHNVYHQDKNTCAIVRRAIAPILQTPYPTPPHFQYATFVIIDLR